jgi:tRNA (cmo5U34)-methyltransferase
VTEQKLVRGVERVEPPKVDHTMPTGPWAFDEEVTDAFEDMLRRSIPQYEVMRRAVFEIGSGFVRDHTSVVDLGCSRGDALAPFVDRFGAYNRFVGVEVSEPMLAVARARFEGHARAGVVDIRALDLRTGYPPVLASLTLAVLTLQFVPIEYRHRIVSDVYASTIPGGAFILVEKVLGLDHETNSLLVSHYERLKREHGYSQDEIERKRLSLEGVLVPLPPDVDESLLRRAGFAHVECFWRFLNFAGWVAIRAAA